MQKAEIGRFDVEFLAPPISPNRDNRASKIEITQKGLGLKEVYTLLRGRCGHVVGRTKSAFTSDGSGDLLRSTETTKFDLNNGALLSFKEEKYASDGRTLVSIEDLTYEPRPYDEPKKVLSRIKILYDVDTHCEAYVFVQEVDPRNKAFHIKKETQYDLEDGLPTVSEQERIHRSTKRVVSEESQEYQKGSLKSSRKRGYDLKTGALTKSKREQWDPEKRTRIFQGLEKFNPKTHKKVFQDEKYWDSASGFLTLRAKSIYNSHGELTFWEQEVHNPDDGMLVSRETERCDPQTGEAVRDRIEYVKIDEETVAAAVEVHKISVGDELTYCRRRELDPQTGKEVKKEVRRGKNFAETTEINPENGTGYCRRENLEPNAGQAVSITDHFKGGKRTERFAVFPENEPSLTA